ncbi:MAG: hypothetical protein ABIP29_00460, partial [Candidatus Eisenbacteria bacterium]
MRSTTRRFVPVLLVAALAAGAFATPSPAAGRIDDMIEQAARVSPQERVVAWVRFTDRAGAEHDPQALDAERARRPARGLERRALRGAVRDLTADDLPVHAPYVRALSARGLVVRGQSRWLNAASVDGPAGAVAALAHLPFVAAVEPVERAGSLRPVE